MQKILTGKELYVLDVDGVVVDSVQIFINGVKYVCETLGYPQKEGDYRELATDIYYEGRIFPPELVKRANNMLLEYTNEERAPVKVELIQGVKDAIKFLIDRELSVAFFTSKSRKGLDLVMGHHGLDDLINFTVTRDCVNQHKPSPEGLHSIIEQLSFQHHQAVMIGDSNYDHDAANNAGVDFIGVHSGINNQLDWENRGVKSIDSIPDLVQLLK